MADLTYAYTITQDELIDPPESMTLGASGLTGVGAAGLDPEILLIDTNTYLLTIGSRTADQLAAACLAYAQARGYGTNDGDSGGAPASTTGKSTVAQAVSALADGTWTPA